MTAIHNAEPAFTLATLILRDPTAPDDMQRLACDVLAQSPDWPDQMLVREARTGFWSTPSSEHGAKFNRRAHLDARPLVMDSDEFLSQALEVPAHRTRPGVVALLRICIGVTMAAWLATMVAGEPTTPQGFEQAGDQR